MFRLVNPYLSWKQFVLIIPVVLFVIQDSRGQQFIKLDTPEITALSDANSRWIDFNIDGRLDLFVSGVKANGLYETSIYLQDVGGNFRVLFRRNFGDAQVSFGDWNNDAYIDVLVSGVISGQRQIFLGLNIHGTGLTLVNLPLEALSQGDLIFEDLDNDCDVDLLMTGLDLSGVGQTWLYRNDAGIFNRVVHQIPGVSNGELDVFDLDRDGWKEVLITGFDGSGSAFAGIFSFGRAIAVGSRIDFPGTVFNSIHTADLDNNGYEEILISGLGDDLQDHYVKIYETDGSGGLREAADLNLELSLSEVSICDLDSDGLSDLLLSGMNGDGEPQLRYYRNQGNMRFALSAHSMPPFFNGDVSAADFDNDGDVDVFQVGNSGSGFQANLYRSDHSEIFRNVAPRSPGNLRVAITGDSALLMWDRPTDDVTAEEGLTFNCFLRSHEGDKEYFLRSPFSDVTSGFRHVADKGNCASNNFRWVTGLSDGRYTWSVQAIDNAFNGSQFPPAEEFVFCRPLALPADTTVCDGSNLKLAAGTHTDKVTWTDHRGVTVSTASELNLAVNETLTLVARVEKQIGCVVTDTVIVRSSSVRHIELGVDKLVCSGETVSFYVDSGSDSLSWVIDGTHLPANNSISIAVDKDMLIEAVLSNEDGCSSFDAVHIGQLTLPEAELGADRSACYGDRILFEVPGKYDALWTSLASGIFAVGQKAELTVTTSDTIIATVIGDNGCINSDSLAIEVLPLPPVDLGPDRSDCQGDLATVHLEGDWTENLWQKFNGDTLSLDTSSFSWTLVGDEELVVSVIDAAGCRASDTLKVIALSRPDIDLAGDRSVCRGEMLSLQVQDGLRATWIATGTGMILSEQPYLDFQPLVSETITLMASESPGCMSYDSIFVQVLEPTELKLPSDTVLCYGDTLSFGLAGLWEGVNWYYGDNIIIAANTPDLLVQVRGTMKVTVVAKDSNACHSSDTMTVSTWPERQLFEEREMTFCERDSLILEGSGEAAFYRWETSEKVLLSTEKFYKVGDPAVGKVFLSAVDHNGCLHRDSISLFSVESPHFVVDGPSRLCAGDLVKLKVRVPTSHSVQWTRFEDPSYVIGKEPEIRFFADASVRVQAKVTNAFGCAGYWTHDVDVLDVPVIQVQGDTILCDGTSLHLEAPTSNITGTSFEWSPQNLLRDFTAAETVTLPIYRRTTFVVKGMTENGCFSYDTVIVDVHPPFFADAGFDTVSLCLGDSLILGGDPLIALLQSGAQLLWFENQNLISTNVSRTVVSPTTTTSYSLRVSGTECPVKDDTVLAIVNPLPVVSVSPDEQIGPGEIAVLSAEGAVSYRWQPAESLSSPFSDVTDAFPLKTTVYTVVGYDINNCRNTATVTVTVQNNLFVPSLFSPNGDNANDFFLLYGSGVATVSLSIFDLNGFPVFFTDRVSDAFETGWDGTLNGQLMQEGTYIWTLQGRYFNGERVTFNGQTRGLIRLVR